MSVDLNWETLTSGPDGEALAERIRSFIHDKFQTVPLPRFIRSVTVHGFDFGTIPPRLELKDITDPLPDFYDQDLDGEDDDDDDEDEEEGEGEELYSEQSRTGNAPNVSGKERLGGRADEGFKPRPPGLREIMRNEMGGGHDLGSFLGTSTPGILGGPGLNYFQSHLGTGTHTPLAAVAGAHLGNAWLGSSALASEVHTPNRSRHPSHGSVASIDNIRNSLAIPRGQRLREKSSVSTLAPTSVGNSRPPTRDRHLTGSAVVDDDDKDEAQQLAGGSPAQRPLPPKRQPRVEDMQAVFRIQYSGDIQLNLTAEILLDYPMPSFVGIPLKLNITGLSFDGVGVLAHIRKRVHFCFLSPDDATAAVGPDEVEDEDGEQSSSRKHKQRFAGLLQEIKVESEIGERESGKQSLKNVGKVERFVLEQVRRIFEEEFVYPSFWTFLV